MTSPDGVAWTARTSAADNNWYYVTWAPELSIFVAVADSGTGNRVMTSPNGITWTTRTSATDNDWISVTWAPELSIFVAVASSGTGNRVMTSPDGITWTARASAANNNWVSVAWAPELSIFVAVGSIGTGNLVMTSAIGMPNSKSVVKALPSQMTVLPSGNVGIGTTNPQVALDVNGLIINTNPSFCVHTNTAYSVSTFTKIIFGAATTNVGGYFNTTTSRFTAPVAGKYYFAFSGMSIGASKPVFQFYKNGVNMGNLLQSFGVVQQYERGTLFGLFILAVNDYIEIFVGESLHSQYNQFVGYLIG